MFDPHNRDPQLFQATEEMIAKKIAQGNPYFHIDDVGRWTVGPVFGGFYFYDEEEDAREAYAIVCAHFGINKPN